MNLRKLLPVLWCGGVVVLSGATWQDAAEPNELMDSRVSESVRDLYLPVSIRKKIDAIDMEKKLKSIIAPESRDATWHRLSAAELLLPMLLASDPVEVVDYEYERGTHDLSMLAGRAAWMIERLNDCELPPVNRHGGYEALTDTHTIATAYASGYRKGLLAREAECADPAAKQRLLLERNPTPIVMNQQMTDFLRQWMPLGKPIRVLEEIMGEEKHIADGVRTYVYGRHTACSFYFVIKDGIIEQVFFEVD